MIHRKKSKIFLLPAFLLSFLSVAADRCCDENLPKPVQTLRAAKQKIVQADKELFNLIVKDGEVLDAVEQDLLDVANSGGDVSKEALALLKDLAKEPKKKRDAQAMLVIKKLRKRKVKLSFRRKIAMWWRNRSTATKTVLVAVPAALFLFLAKKEYSKKLAADEAARLAAEQQRTAQEAEEAARAEIQRVEAQRAADEAARCASTKIQALQRGRRARTRLAEVQRAAQEAEEAAGAGSPGPRPQVPRAQALRQEGVGLGAGAQVVQVSPVNARELLQFAYGERGESVVPERALSVPSRPTEEQIKATQAHLLGSVGVEISKNRATWIVMSRGFLNSHKIGAIALYNALQEQNPDLSKFSGNDLRAFLLLASSADGRSVYTFDSDSGLRKAAIALGVDPTTIPESQLWLPGAWGANKTATREQLARLSVAIESRLKIINDARRSGASGPLPAV